MAAILNFERTGDCFRMDGTVVYHVILIAFTFAFRRHIHVDIMQTRGIKLTIPLMLSLHEFSPPELDIFDPSADHKNERDETGRYRTLRLSQNNDASFAVVE